MTRGFPSSWVYAAGRGYMAGRFSDASLHDHPYYRNTFLWEPERYIFRLQFDRGRRELNDRISRGVEQPPGSVYNPALDDRAGAMLGVNPRAA